jgi:capsid protein
MTALDSSGYNYASGRMDHQLYQQTIRTERDELQHVALDRIFCAWLDEAVPLGMIPRGLPPIAEWNWAWTWDGREHVDPGKEANAAETRLRTHTTTLAHEYAKQGKDWQVELAQRAKEVAQMRSLGLLVDLEPSTNYTGQGAGEEEGGEQ